MASLRPLCFNSIRSPKRFILTPFHQFRNSRVPLQLQRCYRVDSNNRHELGFPSESKQQYQRFRKAQPPFYQSQRFWITMGTGGGLIGGYYVTHLETVPVTDRRRFIDVTLEQEEAMAKQAYREVMLQYGNKILSSNHPYTVYVRRIAERLIQVSGMQNLKWEFHVVDSPERNAFVLPGGKVFVFTGILPIVANEGTPSTMCQCFQVKKIRVPRIL
ncbi:hypothetical protein BC937DRAFT_88997 [Endogone sp. FLAS-F59071]|nr:hypothetical protein BC937DRAFT_88997 [Endogone sp. FLAS-F59071]|eukprot:RUS18249.1 hypothetical protein BC937DRAFT_88997 [Endogone sp. FLAS-F59071]